ncbi:hypothetical protein LIER_23876 [Lithospermum erythrorhizon]|uniref:Phytosulfokine n=1 Tax=Lithospermum erythrorhizon TaxID=34254 RepID=A0AAV3R2A5_LITER
MLKPRSASLLFFLVILATSMFTLTCASRAGSSLQQTHEYKGDAIGARHIDETRLCDGLVDNDECLMMRRTLAAHLDYIYTQKEKP